jgi:hypothetical protein
MNGLEERLHMEIVAAMKKRDTSSLVPLRMLKAAIDNAKVEKGRIGPLSDDDIFAVIRRLVKQRKEAAEQYSSAGATERAEEEIRESVLLSSFLPASMADEDILSVVRRVTEETGALGPSDLGKVMGRVMAELKGKAEGERVRETVSRYLASI